MGLGSGIRDPRSGIWEPEKTFPDPGVKKAPDPGSGSATLMFSKLKLPGQPGQILLTLLLAPEVVNGIHHCRTKH
jgi:hypothetical protein